MWLPKDERRLLEGYYVNIGEIEKGKWFEVSNWIPVVDSLLVKHKACEIKGYLDGGKQSSNSNALDPKDPAGSIKMWIKKRNRIDIANKSLKARELIELHNHQSESDVKSISLTIQGYDLGRKYSSWWTRSGLWFREYKDHWIWLIASFLEVLSGHC